MAIVTEQYCLDDFTIQVRSRVNCELEINSDFQPPEYNAADLADAPPTVDVGFMYAVGSNPVKTDFASIYTKTRQGGTQGVPPDLGNRAFAPPTPDQTGAANLLKAATFSVVAPTYSPADATNLGAGTDNYAVSIIIRTASHQESIWASQNFQS